MIWSFWQAKKSEGVSPLELEDTKVKVSCEDIVEVKA